MRHTQRTWWSVHSPTADGQGRKLPPPLRRALTWDDALNATPSDSVSGGGAPARTAGPDSWAQPESWDGGHDCAQLPLRGGRDRRKAAKREDRHGELWTVI
jgi:hypothetical protein